MAKKIKSSVSALTRELRSEIALLEKELKEKKEILLVLDKLSGRKTTAKRKGRLPAAGTKRGGKGKKGPVRRKSKNRDMVLEAASVLKAGFSLQDLLKTIHKKHPKFGGKYPSSTLITVLRTTPEVKKIKRGTYKYTG